MGHLVNKKYNSLYQGSVHADCRYDEQKNQIKEVLASHKVIALDSEVGWANELSFAQAANQCVYSWPQAAEDDARGKRKSIFYRLRAG
jgi:hypothetical protein